VPDVVAPGGSDVAGASVGPVLQPARRRRVAARAMVRMAPVCRETGFTAIGQGGARSEECVGRPAGAAQLTRMKVGLEW